jgi:DHA2 family multidrug resistance protein
MAMTLAFSACFGNRENRKLRLIIGLFGMTVATWQLTRIDLFTEKEWVSIVFAVWAGSAGLVASPVICISEHNLQPNEIVKSLSIRNLALLLPGLICGGFIEITTERAGDAYFDVLRQTIQPNRIPVDDVSVGLADWIASNHGSEPDVAMVQTSQVLSRYIRVTASVYADQTAFGWLSIMGALAFVLSLFLWKLPPEAPGSRRG